MSASVVCFRCLVGVVGVFFMSFMTVFVLVWVGWCVRCFLVGVWVGFVVGVCVFGFGGCLGYGSPKGSWCCFFVVLWGQVGGGPRGLDVNHFFDVSLALCVPHNRVVVCA